MAVLWRVVDRLGRAVVLTEAGWGHIMERHGHAMADRAWSVRDAVRRADWINRDADRADRECHYRQTEPNRPMLKIVIEFGIDRSTGTLGGVVITAYPTESEKPREVRRWP